MSRRVAPILITACLALAPLTAQAKDEDKAACANLREGDACTRSDGDPGVCVPDDSDPVLTCEDDVSDNLSCAVGERSGLLGLAGLALLLAFRRAD
jgi:hypothetical protein